MISTTIRLAPLALLIVASPARADRALERARTEIGELRYDDAQKTVDKALRSGRNSPEQMTELYLLLGEVQASLGDDEAAQDAFRRALVIDPGAELRKGLSPKIKEPF